MEPVPTDRASSPGRAWYASPVVLVLVVVALLVAGGLAAWLLRPGAHAGQGVGDPPRAFRYLALGDSLPFGARDGEPDDTDESRNFRDHNASVGKARSYSQSNSEGMPGAAGIPAAQRSLHHRSAPAIETRDLMEPSLGRYSMPWKTTVYSQNR